MSLAANNPRSRNHCLFRWEPGHGPDTAALERMRDQFRRPKMPMGEAWFMGDQRRMFDLLLGDLDGLPLDELTLPLWEIASGNSSFGPRQEWTDWYGYLLAQLVPRHAEQTSDSLYQNLVAAFIAIHPRGIEDHYPGFAEDAMETLGRCLMDDVRWTGSRLAVPAPADPFAGGRNAAWKWDVACGDFSAGMFLCAKYLDIDQLDGWLDSVFAIPCPLWRTQLYMWLLAAHPLLSGQVLTVADLDERESAEAQWSGSLVLKGDYTGNYAGSPTSVPLLSVERCERVLASVSRNVSVATYFAWLDDLKAHDYLEALLGTKPSSFAEVYDFC